MKEADIKFGQLYAIKFNDDQPLCMRVDKKDPPKFGATRSRTYRISHPGTDINGIPDWQWTRIDASKILMPWKEYEKTAAYAVKHEKQVTDDLDQVLINAIDDWQDTFFEYLDQLARKYGPRSMFLGRMALKPQDIGSTKDVVDALLRHQVSLTIGVGDLLKLLDDGEKPMVPDAPAVTAALQQREEVLEILELSRKKRLAAEVFKKPH